MKDKAKILTKQEIKELQQRVKKGLKNLERLAKRWA